MSVEAYQPENEGEWEKSIQVTTKLIQLKKEPHDRAMLYCIRSYAYITKGKYDLALEDLNEAIKLNPQYVDAYMGRGAVYIIKGEYDLALEDLNEAIKLNPQYVDAYMGRGAVYIIKGEYDLAVEDFNEAIKLNPQHVDAYMGRGAVYIKKGEYDRALEYFNEAIKLNSQHADAYLGCGVVYIKKGEYDLAVKYFNEAIKLNSRHADAYLGCGAVYIIKGEYDLALEYFNKAIKLNPQHADAYLGRSAIYITKGEYDRAFEDLNETIKLNPQHADAYYGRGIAYINEQNFERALEDFNETIKLNPQHANAYYGRGIAYINKQNFDRALEDFNKATKLNPQHSSSHYACGITYLRKSDFSNAFKKFNTIAEKHPTLKTSEPLVYIASQISGVDSLKESEQIKAFEIYVSLLDIVSEIRYELFYTSKELKSGVAHYTSLHTLRNLSEGGECFRLYNADYMNDPEEGQVFFKIMNKEHGIDIEKDFYENKDKSYRSPAYIGSFVLFEGEDKLSLWRTYGKHDTEEAAGVCLIFNDKQCFSENMPYQYGRMTENLQPANINPQPVNINLKLVNINLQLTNMMRNDAIKDSSNVQKLALYKIYYQGESDDELKKELQKLRDQLKNTEEIINDELQENKVKEKLGILGKQLKVIEKIINNGVQEEKIKKELQELGKRVEIINQFIEKVQEKETKNILRRLARELLDSIRFLFKERYYRDEKERRVILWRYGERNKSLGAQIKADMGNIPPRFYMEAPENFWFSKVILGPRLEHARQWQRWFKAQDEDIEIDQSKIPYGKS